MEHGILILLLSALVVFVWRARQKRSAKHKAASHSAAVHLQHVYLFQGGQLSESQVESARVRIEKQLNARRQESVFAEMKPTTDFAMQVQALAQIGTRSAVEILEKQLRCSITSNPQEQAWYWLDITRALRQLNWDESLPLLFDCVVESPAPLNQFLAAETVCFPNFISFLQNGDLKSRRASARLLHLALQGLRSGVQPHVVVSGRMGEAVAALWESHWEEVDPVAVRIIQEALRLLQRAGHLERLLGEELWERYQEQIQQIDLLAESFTDWLREARLVLPEQLIRAGTDEQSELLRAAIDLRADTASFVRPMLEVNQMRAPELAVASLAFTKQDGIGEWLCRWVSECGNRRNWKLWRKTAKRGGPVYLTVLRTLRHFPCHEA